MDRIFKKSTPPKSWKVQKTPPLSFKRLLFWLKFTKTIFGKYQTRFTLFLLGLAIFALIFKNLIPNLPIFRNNLVIGVVGEYRIDNLPQGLTQLFSQGLTRFSSNGAILPDLAKSWETENGKNFKFYLNDNLIWQDGKKLTASDIQFQIPNVEPKILDEKTIEFNLADTFSPYLSTLTKPVFRKNSQIGTAPYKIEKITKNGDILKQIFLAPTKDNLPKVLIRFFPNSQTAVTAYKTGQIGILFNLMRLNGLEKWKATTIEKTLDPSRLVAVFYNTKDRLLSNQKIRKALDLTIDRSKFENFATGPYPANSWVYFEMKPVFDLKKAQKIIGEERGTGGKIQILAPPIFENLASEIAASWQSLSFEVEVEKIDKIPQDFQVAIFGLEIPPDPDQYNFWHSTQSQSLTKIEDPKIDKLLEDGRKLIKAEERKAVYADLQKELRGLVPASFLFFPNRYIVINKNSQNKLSQIKKLFPEFPIN